MNKEMKIVFLNTILCIIETFLCAAADLRESARGWIVKIVLNILQMYIKMIRIW